MLLTFYELAVPGPANPPASSRILAFVGTQFIGAFPVVTNGEVHGFGIDFSAVMIGGNSIASTTMSVSAVNGDDPDAATLISTPPQVAGNLVSATLGPNWQPRVLYELEIEITTAFGDVFVAVANILSISV